MSRVNNKFVSTISKFKKEIEVMVNEVHAESVLDLQRAIMEDTPVKTGRLKTNWIATIGAPALTAKYSKSYDWNKSTGTFGWDKTKRESRRELKNIKTGDTVFLTNNVTYGALVEFIKGYSKKSPDGMVLKNTIRWQYFVSYAVSIVRHKHGK